jgi:hypothetical protein
VTILAKPSKPALSGKIGWCTVLGRAVTRAVPPRPNSVFPGLWKITAVAPDSQRRCTAVHLAVYTVSDCDHLHCVAQDQDQLVTALGAAAHQTCHGGAPRASASSPISPPFFTFANVLIVQVFHRYVQVC